MKHLFPQPFRLDKTFRANIVPLHDHRQMLFAATSMPYLHFHFRFPTIAWQGNIEHEHFQALRIFPNTERLHCHLFQFLFLCEAFAPSGIGSYHHGFRFPENENRKKHCGMSIRILPVVLLFQFRHDTFLPAHNLHKDFFALRNTDTVPMLLHNLVQHHTHCNISLQENIVHTYGLLQLLLKTIQQQIDSSVLCQVLRNTFFQCGTISMDAVFLLPPVLLI